MSYGRMAFLYTVFDVKKFMMWIVIKTFDYMYVFPMYMFFLSYWGISLNGLRR